MLFYQEKGGPNIYIGKADDSHIHYSYEIPLVNGFPADEDVRTYGDVTYYRIERIRIYPDGTKGNPEFVAEGTPNQPRESFKGTEIKDDKVLDPGIYQYKITTKRANTGNEPFEAFSNRVQIDGDNTTNAIAAVNADADFNMTVTLGAGSGTLAVSANDTIGEITVYAMNGMLAHRGTINGTAGTLNVAGLPDSIYIVKARNQAGEIEVDRCCRTPVKGVYAAGDVTDIPYKQVVIAMGEGGKAALSAFLDFMRGELD